MRDNILILLAVGAWIMIATIIIAFAINSYVIQEEHATLQRSHAEMWERQEAYKNNPCVHCHFDNKGKFTVPESWDCTREERGYHE